MRSLGLLHGIHVLILLLLLISMQATPATAQTLLVDDAAWPSWSPDGTEIIFNRNDMGALGFAEVWRVVAIGGEPELLLSDLMGANRPMWMPDGSHIVWYRVRWDLFDPRGEFVVHDLEGGEPVIWNVDLINNDSWFCLSPDGSEVIFTSSSGDLMALDLSNGFVRLVRAHCASGALSPDGQWLAFSTGDEMLTIEPVSGGASILVEPGYMARWTPDSKWIVFVGLADAGSGDSVNTDLIVVSREGTHRQQLTSGPDLDWYHDVSPAGNQVAFTRSEEENGHATLYLVDLSPTTTTPTSWSAIKLRFQ